MLAYVATTDPGETWIAPVTFGGTMQVSVDGNQIQPRKVSEKPGGIDSCSVSATSYDGIAVSSDALWQARLWVVGGMAVAGIPWLWLAVYRRSALALLPAFMLLAIGIMVAASLPSASDYTVF